MSSQAIVHETHSDVQNVSAISQCHLGGPWRSQDGAASGSVRVATGPVISTGVTHCRPQGCPHCRPPSHQHGCLCGSIVCTLFCECVHTLCNNLCELCVESLLCSLKGLNVYTSMKPLRLHEEFWIFIGLLVLGEANAGGKELLCPDLLVTFSMSYITHYNLLTWPHYSNPCLSSENSA